MSDYLTDATLIELVEKARDAADRCDPDDAPGRIYDLADTIENLRQQRGAVRIDILAEVIDRIEWECVGEPAFGVSDVLRLLNNLWMAAHMNPADPGPTSPGPGSAVLCRCGHTITSHFPNRCFGCTGPECGTA